MYNAFQQVQVPEKKANENDAGQFVCLERVVFVSSLRLEDLDKPR